MTTQRVLLVFPRSESDKPVVNELIRRFDLTVNLIRARITPEEEGHMVLDLIGRQKDIREGLRHIRDMRIQVDETTKGLQWDANRCVHCGNCISHCPTDALSVKDRKTMAIGFDSDSCIECLSCIKNCPYGACTSLFLQGHVN